MDYLGFNEALVVELARWSKSVGSLVSQDTQRAVGTRNSLRKKESSPFGDTEAADGARMGKQVAQMIVWWMLEVGKSNYRNPAHDGGSSSPRLS